MAKSNMKGVTCQNGYWYARVDGARVSCGKGKKGERMAKAARAKYDAKQYERRQSNTGLKVKKAQFNNIQQMSDWYFSLPKVQELKSYDRKVYSAVHLMKYFGEKQVNHVEGDDQEHYRERRREQGAAHGTVNNEINLLSAMYHLAMKRKKIRADDMPGEFVNIEDRNPRRMITDKEYERLLKHADPDFRDLLICAWESAMRSGEICRLTASQVHLGKVQHISGKKVDYIDLGIFDTKNGARRTVPVSPTLKEVLARRLKGLGPESRVFTDVRGAYTGKIPDRMGYLCKKANVLYGDKLINKKGERVGIVFHCFRHTRTTKWVEAGFSDEIIRRATGHKDLNAYRQYVKLDPSAVMRLVEDANPKTAKKGIKAAQDRSEAASRL